MKATLKKICAVTGVVVAALASQPVLADGGWGHHHGGYGRGWAPFALGAVVGGVAVGAMMQPQPVYAQPVYAPPPVYMRPRVVVPPPVYMVPPPPPPVYYTY